MYSLFIGLFIRGLGALLGVLSTVVITRTLDLSDIGKYFYLLSLIVFFGSFSTMGLTNTILKYGNHNYALKSILLFSIKRTIFFSIISALIFILIILFKGYEWSYFFILMIIPIFIIPFNNLFSSILQLRGGINKSFIGLNIIQPVIFISLVICVYFYSLESYETYILLFLISLLFCMFFLYSNFNLEGKGKGKEFKNEKYIDYGINNALGLLLTQSFIIISGFLLSPEQLGVIAISTKLCMILTIVSSTIVSTITPKFSQYIIKNQVAELINLLKQSIFVFIFLSIVVFLFFILFSNNLLVFFNKGYQDQSIPLILLISGQIINTICMPLFSFLNMAGKEIFIKKVQMIILIPSILLLYLLTYKLSVIGVGVASIIIFSLLNIPILFFSLRYLKHVKEIKKFH